MAILIQVGPIPQSSLAFSLIGRCGSLAWSMTLTKHTVVKFFALSALYGWTLLRGNLIGAYLVMPASENFHLISPLCLILSRERNIYRLLFSCWNFSKAEDAIIFQLGNYNTPHDSRFFYTWIDGMPIPVILNIDDFKWFKPRSSLRGISVEN